MQAKAAAAALHDTFSTLTVVFCMQLEELNITGEQSNDNWHVGLDCIPDEWAGMTRLTKLELRGHSLLNVSETPFNLQHNIALSHDLPMHIALQ